MKNMLMIYPDRCTGCRICELACSFFHDGEFRPSASRIQVRSWEIEGISVPTTCGQCDDAPCVLVCPTGAMFFEPEEDRVGWDKTKCIGCRMCTLACPFGAVAYQTEGGRILKCDLCDGAPECTALCPAGALEFLAEADAARARRKTVAEGLKKTYAEVE